MNRPPDEHRNHKVHQYHQQQTYPAHSHQQQQQQQRQNQQQRYATHQSCSNQPLQQAHQHQIQQQLQAHIQPQLHIDNASTVNSAQVQKTWSSQQNVQPRSHYPEESDQVFKGATEHLLSAVQQQLDSMRDHEPGEVVPQKQSYDEPLCGTSSDRLGQTGTRNQTPQSDDGLVSLHVRITEHGKEEQEQEKNENEKSKQEDSTKTHGQSMNNVSASCIEQQVSNHDNVPEHRKADQSDSTAVPTNHSAGQCVPVTSPLHVSVGDHITGHLQSTDSTCSNLLSEKAHTLLSTPMLSQSEVPTLYNTPKFNKGSSVGQSQHKPISQTESIPEQEKGIIWQTLIIGGKKIKYKVLGNVKVHKASPLRSKQAVPVLTQHASNAVTECRKMPGTNACNKPSIVKDEKGSITNLIPVKRPSKDLANNDKIVKVLPDIRKRERQLTHASNSPDGAEKPKKSKLEISSKEISSTPLPSRMGRLTKLDIPTEQSEILQEGHGSATNLLCAIVKQMTTTSSKKDVSNTEAPERTMAEEPPDGGALARQPEVIKGKNSEKHETSILQESNSHQGIRKEERTITKYCAEVKHDSQSNNSYRTTKAASFGLCKDVQEHKVKSPERRCSPRRKRFLPKMHLEKDVLSESDLVQEDTPGSSYQSQQKCKEIVAQPLKKETVKKHLKDMMANSAPLLEETPGSSHQSHQKSKEIVPQPLQKKTVKKQKTSRVTRWSNQEIRALAGFLISAKKAGLYKKEWPTIRDNKSLWQRAADCCNVVRLDKKKRTGNACAHWTHCYIKSKFVTTSQMSFHFNSTEYKNAGLNASPDQYETCKCYRPICKKVSSKTKRRTKTFRVNDMRRDRGVQASTLRCFKETQTTVSAVSVSNGLKEFVSMLTAKDALEVADLSLHFALKEKKLYNVADNFLELCIGAFGVLQKYRQTNLIEEFARVLATSRDDGLPRMQPDKMPFAMIAYNIRYFNNTSPFGLTVPLPYAEWLHSMYNIFGQRFHEMFEGPTPGKLDIADRHPYRSQLLNVATVSKAYLKRQTDEKDKAAAENPPEKSQEASQDAYHKKLLMNKQGRALRELMTDVAIPPLARRKLQQAFAIIQHTSDLTTPENEPTCDHCGAAIPRPPKPPRKYIARKRDRKRLKGDAPIRSKNEFKKRRIDTSKLVQKQTSVNISRQGKRSVGQIVTQEQTQTSVPAMQPTRPPQTQSPYPTELYHSTPNTGHLDRMLINAPGVTPGRSLPPNLQDKWIPSQPDPSQQGWAPSRALQVADAAAAVAAAARGMYPNQATVDIMWQPGQPSSGWQQGEVRTSTQQQQHSPRTQMEPNTSSGSVVHIGQSQVTHSYY